MVKHHFAASSTYKAKQFGLAALGFASDTGAFWGHTSSAMIRNRLTDLILHARYAVPLFIYGFECSLSTQKTTCLRVRLLPVPLPPKHLLYP